MATNDIITRLRVEGQVQYQAAMDRSAKSVEKVGTESQKSSKLASGAIKRWAASAAGLYSAQQVIKDSIGNAVNLGEEINKTSVVFRGSEKDLISWSKTSATSMGASQQEALAAMSTFGNMLVPMGFARDRAAQMSKRMAGLAGDMASFNNASPQEVLEALRSGLAGETEPLRRFGVFLSDARLKQEAMNQGLYKGKGPLTAQAKAAATYAVILKDTKDAQGDFARTSDSLANRQRVLRAQYANLTAQIGTKLIPVLKFLMDHLKAVTAVVGILSAAWVVYKLHLMWVATASLRAAVASKALTVAQWLLNTAMLAFPAVAIIAGIAAIGVAFVLAYKKVRWFRDGVDAVVKFIKSHWKLMAAGLVGPIGLAVYAIVKNFGKIKAGAEAVIRYIADRFRDLGHLIGRVVSGITSLPGKALHKLGGLVPGAQHGGHVLRGGLFGVGEAGPELVALPSGSTVYPHGQMPAIAAASSTQTTAHFYLDRKLIATAVATDTADRQARR